jgi:hypothetical protein
MVRELVLVGALEEGKKAIGANDAVYSNRHTTWSAMHID